MASRSVNKPSLAHRGHSSTSLLGMELGIPPGRSRPPEEALHRASQRDNEIMHLALDEMSPESTSPWEVTIRRELSPLEHSKPAFLEQSWPGFHQRRSSSVPLPLLKSSNAARHSTKINKLTGSNLTSDSARSLPIFTKAKSISPVSSDTSSVYSQVDPLEQSAWCRGSLTRSSDGYQNPATALHPPGHRIHQRRRTFSRQREERLLRQRLDSIPTDTSEDQELPIEELLALKRGRFQHDLDQNRNHQTLDGNSDLVPIPLALQPKQKEAIPRSHTGSEDIRQPYGVHGSGNKPYYYDSTDSSSSPVGTMESDFIALPPIPPPPTLPRQRLKRFGSDTKTFPPPRQRRPITQGTGLRIQTKMESTEKKSSKRQRISEKMRRLSRRSSTKITIIPISSRRIANGPDTQMPEFTRPNATRMSSGHIHEVIAKAKQKMTIKSRDERKREKLKKSIVYVGMGDQSLGRIAPRPVSFENVRWS